MVNSQKKGKTFEREVAHLLTDLTGKPWRRVPTSGAMATLYDLQDSRFQGDLFCEDDQYKDWLIECKITGQPLNLAALTSSKSQLWAWWAQAKNEAKGKQPVLIFRCKNSPTFALMKKGHPAMGLLTDNIGIVRGEELSLGIIKERKDGDKHESD